MATTALMAIGEGTIVRAQAPTAAHAADIAAIMVGGRIVNVGKPEDLEDELSAAYLGGPKN